MMFLSVELNSVAFEVSAANYARARDLAFLVFVMRMLYVVEYVCLNVWIFVD